MGYKVNNNNEEVNTEFYEKMKELGFDFILPEDDTDSEEETNEDNEEDD